MNIFYILIFAFLQNAEIMQTLGYDYLHHSFNVEEYCHEFYLEADNRRDIIVGAEGIDVRLTIYNPDGHIVLQNTVDTYPRFMIFPKKSGTYRAEVTGDIFLFYLYHLKPKQ